MQKSNFFCIFLSGRLLVRLVLLVLLVILAGRPEKQKKAVIRLILIYYYFCIFLFKRNFISICNGCFRNGHFVFNPAAKMHLNYSSPRERPVGTPCLPVASKRRRII